MRNYRFTAFFLSILILLSGLSVFATEPETSSDAYSGITVGEATPEATPEPEQIHAAEENEGFYCDKLTNPNSKSIFMVSLDTDTVVYTLNPDEQRPMASLTKIMSYIVIAELVDDLHNTRFTVPEEVQTELQGTNSSLAEIKVGEEFSIFELLNLMMVPSGNDAALTLAKFVDGLKIKAEAEDQPYDENGDGIMSFVEMMNRKAAELGCTNTHFMNPHGLHHVNHYSTAREIAVMSKYALSLPYFAEVTSQQYYNQPPTNLTEEERLVQTSNRMLLSWYDEYYTYATGIKTGSLNESGYCISASGHYEGYSYLVVCMGSPYITETGERTHYHGEMFDAATLLRWAFLNIENKTIVEDGDLIGEVGLQYAWEQDTLQVLAKGHVTAMMPRVLGPDDIQIKLDLPESVKAPVKKGAEIGTATYIFRGEEIAVIPLIASESVERSELIQTVEQGKEILTSGWFIVTAIVIALLTVAYIALMISMNRKRRQMRRIRKYRDL
ncbi:MAG: D-alanyl-D-alanine carboxypeptidase [Clostridia bacterium]|nr:D-alanyl-D-alanine carboxypeptidase [Clostridia bacterium]